MKSLPPLLKKRFSMPVHFGLSICRGVILALACLSGLASAQGYVHFSHRQSSAPFPAAVVLATPEIEVRELTAAGSLEKVPQWAEQASRGVATALQRVVADRRDLKVVAMPTLTDAEQEQFEDFLAAYWVVGQSAHLMMQFGGSAWEHRRTQFDYTLGEGLPWLREKTGADAVIVSLGDDIVSSGGRIAMTVLAAAAGVALPTGRSIITFGVVNLNNGDIAWLHYDQSGVRDLKNPESAKVMTEAVFKTLPEGGKPVAKK